MKAYNKYEGVCFFHQNDDAPHCIGYESGDTPEGFNTIPYGRGDGGENPILSSITLITAGGSTLIGIPTVIVVTMLLMYRSVSKVEQRMQNYAGYSFAWAFVFIPFVIVSFLHQSYAAAILHACLTPLQGLLNVLVFMSPKVRNAKRSRRGENLTCWRRASIKAYMSRGERKRMGENLTSRNTRTSNRVSLLQREEISLKSLLSRTRITRESRSNESNVHITTNDQSSNPRQVRAPAEKLTLSNPHLVDGDMKETEGNNAMRPQKQENFLTVDGDDEEKCKEQKASLSHIG
jgi:hypothetical protein